VVVLFSERIKGKRTKEGKWGVSTITVKGGREKRKDDDEEEGGWMDRG